jgi:hypothetical protein
MGYRTPSIAFSMIDALQTYMARFAGYGDLRAPLWFVGMEEGGGRDVAELTKRVDTWDARGRQRLEDLASYHRAVDMPYHFDAPYPLQRTWGPLARILQSSRGASTDLSVLREVQATQLGAHGGGAALLELLPLPAPGTVTWPYSTLAPHIPALRDRATYRATYEPARLAMLRALIHEGGPRVVICYGLGYRKAWSTLAGAPLRPIGIADRTCYVGEGSDPMFLAVPHPVARGGKSRFWEAVGSAVAVRTA